jgi:hypothetical protein
LWRPDEYIVRVSAIQQDATASTTFTLTNPSAVTAMPGNGVIPATVSAVSPVQSLPPEPSPVQTTPRASAGAGTEIILVTGACFLVRCLRNGKL